VKLRKWLFWLAGLSFLIAGVLVLLPHAIGYGLQRWLDGEGAGPSSIDNVDFNPFTATLVIEGLRAGGPAATGLQAQRLSLRFAWGAFWHRRIHVRELSLSAAAFQVVRDAEGAVHVGGLPLPMGVEGEGGEPWGIGLDGLTLQDVHMAYRDPQLEGTVAVAALSLGAIATWDPRQAGALRVQAAVNGGGVDLNASVQPFAVEPNIQGRLLIHDLDLAPFAGIAEAYGIHDLAARLSTDLGVSSTRRKGGDGVTLALDGTVDLTGVALASERRTLNEAELTWQGMINLGRLSDGTTNMSARGQLRGPRIALTLTDWATHVEQRDLIYNGLFEYRSDSTGEGALVAKGDILAKGLRVGATDRSMDRLRTESVALNGIVVEGVNSISIGGIQLGATRIGESRDQAAGEAKQPYALSFVAGGLDDVKLRGLERVSVDKVWVDGAVGYLARNPDGDMRFAQGVVPASPKSKAESSQPAREGASVEWRVGALEVRGESRLVFEDESVAPTYRVSLDDLKMYLGPLDSATPGEDSRLEFRARPGKYSVASATGTIRPLAERPSMDLRVKVERFDLPALTPYSAYYMGYAVDRGQLDADVDLRIIAGELDTAGRLQLSKLQLAALDTPEARQLGERLGMPLESAFAMLRDRHGNIQLRIPVTGDIRSPQFDFRDAINQAMAKALRTAILTYYQPLGVLVTATRIVGKAGALRFNPVEFPAGSAQLTPAATEYLDQMARLLQDRPETRPNLCGLAVAKDAERRAPGAKPPTTEELTALAGQRGESVKDYLVSFGKIGPGRLFLCSPQVDAQDEAVPRVEITL
jgi:hypothetical protein